MSVQFTLLITPSFFAYSCTGPHRIKLDYFFYHAEKSALQLMATKLLQVDINMYMCLIHLYKLNLFYNFSLVEQILCIM